MTWQISLLKKPIQKNEIEELSHKDPVPEKPCTLNFYNKNNGTTSMSATMKLSDEIEDYACYAFPALRSLEGYLMQLFSMEDIVITHTFGSQSGTHFNYKKQTDSFVLRKKTADELTNSKSKEVLEEVYNYFNKNRHQLFHTDQILYTTVILESKLEADRIVYDVINMIERTYTYLTA
ncbi:RNase LS family HEPN domain-containing protein [Sporosarcina sp. GW1-11]|uniref:RNase LS family HEPN domain-containing protein n=1 Tax=Sporosarcina sp. GW1-11 TaxID=2899126 RepID=UPI00294FADDD|nr:RNase LS family HEPN domain-containing protein [Sporosarcina sp. GW1-11]MDV6378203.1 RNase LS family HEPN domain-containing protein [Sporosarcina sp. GW1-11]